MPDNNELLPQPLPELNLQQELPPVKFQTYTDTEVPYFTSPVFASSIMLFLISVMIFALMYKLIDSGKDAGEVLKTFGIPLIIVASVYVVITGVEVSQLTPIIGLLGTIAGYLLGQTVGSANNHQVSSKNNSTKNK